MILVTGGTGLVGSHLLYQLTTNNNPVRAIYRNKNKLALTKKIFSYYSENPDILFNKIDWVEADLLDIPLLTEAFKGITHVYHAAAFVSFEPDKYHLLRKTNIEGTANIVNLSIANKIEKLCYVSSVATIGSATSKDTLNELTLWNPEADNSVYSITKYGAEMEVWRGTQEGLDAVIVNPGVIIGPGIWNYGSGNIFKKVYNGLPFYTKGVTGYVGIEDVVLPMMKLMESPIKNERFILVSENWPYKQFIDKIATSLNVKAPSKKASSLLLQMGWRLDWLKHKLTGKRRRLSKQLVHTLNSKSVYGNTKLKNQLNYQFKPLEKSITEVASIFLKEH
ncbi:MAG: NAD-dependent epimerase [Xanthomarina sp.]|uniref:NAD-dependent epimerase/dehydratase family protein n=1 Tax=Xanthomarina sp. TaxID=1931211 RepID=UPI000C554222|nr:NAD-dependent epimerase/dehydratase family protein [Xanthomarina sp.]MAL22184.1 NAD-dependent epimerase [Xanthomarina sp.]MBF61679.1 NAD-dependent epimerase [Xanthomarina sp.]HAI19888.1 NAD-dependent epimerase [Xanthomarina gelatinilytica]|tara:strand:- start:736 stop:1743 length:1008 start_codon:yes stop_codon:yes gene_type:complete